jgi:hypothetical protein
LVGAVHQTALAIEVNRRYLKFQKNYQLSPLIADSLISTYRKKNVNFTSFVLFEIFHLSCLPFRKTRNGLTEK